MRCELKVNGERVRLHGGGDWRLGEGQGNTIEELDEMEILQNARVWAGGGVPASRPSRPLGVDEWMSVILLDEDR